MNFFSQSRSERRTDLPACANGPVTSVFRWAWESPEAAFTDFFRFAMSLQQKILGSATREELPASTRTDVTRAWNCCSRV